MTKQEMRENNMNEEKIIKHLNSCPIKELREIACKMAKGLIAVDDLMQESSGIYGLHLNDDASPWSELQTGGLCEEWLVDYDDALDAIMGE